MRKLLIPLVAAVGLALAGCAGDSVLRGGTSITASITNPVGINQLYEVESAVAITRRAGVAYFRLRQCRRSEQASLTNPCARRSVKVQIQQADQKVSVGLGALRRFVRDNPDVNAIQVANAVWAALGEYQAVLAANGVR